MLKKPPPKSVRLGSLLSFRKRAASCPEMGTCKNESCSECGVHKDQAQAALRRDSDEDDRVWVARKALIQLRLEDGVVQLVAKQDGLRRLEEKQGEVVADECSSSASEPSPGPCTPPKRITLIHTASKYIKTASPSKRNFKITSSTKEQGRNLPRAMTLPSFSLRRKKMPYPHPAARSVSDSAGTAILSGLVDSYQSDDEERVDDKSCDSAAIVKSGYLWKRSSGVRKDWKRRWFYLQGGKLKYQRDENHLGPAVVVVDVMLCRLRPAGEEEDQATRWSFEILSPQRRTYCLQAESEQEYKDWTETIRAETEERLALELHRPGSWISKKERQNSTDEQTSIIKMALKELLTKNQTCADCGDARPDWASINLGVLICIECSGVHRSLGVHVSKIRSCTLDTWALSTVKLMQSIGNETANKTWLGALGSPRGEGFTGLDPSASRAQREVYIRQKYVEKKFASGILCETSQPNKLNQSLQSAVEDEDVKKMMDAIIQGAEIDWISLDSGQSALHKACALGNIVCAEYLIQNGANLELTDKENLAPVDLAIQSGNAELISLLSANSV